MTVDISKLVIDKIEVYAVDSSGERVSSLIPGLEYRIMVNIYSNDEFIENPNYSKITFYSKNNSLLSVEDFFSHNKFIATDDSFMLLGEEFYLTIGIKENPYPTEEYVWPVNWNYYSIKIDHSGTPGGKGSDGRNGKNGSNTSKFFVDGDDGSDGTNGSNGKDGGDVTVLVGFYRSTENQSTMLFAFDLEKEKIYVSILSDIIIDVSGGNGGAGGNGGNGGKGGVYTETTPPDPDATFPRFGGETTYGKDGEPGGGGHAGNGGDGGNIRLLYYTDEVPVHITKELDGGFGGKGGEAGTSPSGGFSSIRAGMNGSAGKKGMFESEQITFDEAIKILSKVEHDKFDINNVKENL